MVLFTPPDYNDSLTKITLDGVSYLFHFSYNYTGEFWTMGIYQDSETPIVAGIKVVPNYALNVFIRKLANLPKGIIGVRSDNEIIGRNDFVDGKAVFIYCTQAEYEEYENSL